MPEQLAALCIGCCGMGLVGLAAAWPLGLGAEVRAALHPDRARQKAKKREIDPDDEIFWTPGHETSIIQWIPWCSRLSSRWPGK